MVGVGSTGVLAQGHTGGRVKDSGNTVQYSWPGVYFEGRVSGTGVGIVLGDPAADYDVQIDGSTVATLVTPGPGSGRGMVRNYNGASPDVTYGTFYDRALLNVSGEQNPGTWRPQVVVVNLGTNDFSTAINPGEPWTSDSLAAGYRTPYGDFIQRLRTRYGVDTTIVAVGAGQYAGHVQQVVKARNDAGDSRVRLPRAGSFFQITSWRGSADPAGGGPSP
ncbi:hypothetical protein J7F01_10805 [Streptomyces sp. ISL-22]|nr:hypothetical protein [Streptomyces sp. ISL-24]MBT2432675.1 hypothetical protein [Streptomyces sp. ISL-22]